MIEKHYITQSACTMSSSSEQNQRKCVTQEPALNRSFYRMYVCACMYLCESVPVCLSVRYVRACVRACLNACLRACLSLCMLLSVSVCPDFPIICNNSEVRSKSKELRSKN